MAEEANGKEEEEFSMGPLSVLMMSVKNNTQQDGVPPAHEMHEYGELSMDEGGDQPGFYPFDLNITFVDNEDHEDLHPDQENAMEADVRTETNAMEEYTTECGVYADDVDVSFEEELSDSDDNEEVLENAHGRSKRKDASNKQRQDIYEALLVIATSNNGKLKRTSTRIIANQFNVSQRTVQRIWERAKKCRRQGLPVDVASMKPKHCGRKKMQIDLSRIAAIPLHKRSTLRKLAIELGVSKSSLHRWFKSGLLRRYSNLLKPCLKEENEEERPRWCISMLDPNILPNDPKFIDMDNIIHIDEKWFSATKKSTNFYMLPDEEDPHRTVQNKNSIDKVMVLSAAGKPKKDAGGNEGFNGKIGVWPFARKCVGGSPQLHHHCPASRWHRVGMTLRAPAPHLRTRVPVGPLCFAGLQHRTIVSPSSAKQLGKNSLEGISHTPNEGHIPLVALVKGVTKDP